MRLAMVAAAVASSAAIATATPVKRLPRTFTPTGYRAHISLEESRLTGHVEIDGDIASDVAWLHAHDLTITGAVEIQDGVRRTLVVQQHGDDEMLTLSGAAPGHATIAIDYAGRISDYEGKRPGGGGDRLTHGVFRRVVDGQTYFFTQSEPIGAREIFPCLDEPDRKVPWQLTLDIPATNVAFANAKLVRETRLDARHLRYEFAPTLPLPSYLVAFAVGEFDVVDGGTTRGGVPIRFVVPHGVAVAPSTTDGVRASIAQLEDYLATPFPYPKLDLVAVPQLGLGAMENAGLITYDSAIVDQGILTPMLAHELTHQWFGDLVTFAWWDDIWLAEVFAGTLPNLATQERDATPPDPPSLSHMRPLRVDVTREWLASWDVEYGHPIIQLMESKVGMLAFQRGLQRYLRDHAHANATSTDLFASIDGSAGTHHAALFEAIANRSSAPTHRRDARMQTWARHGDRGSRSTALAYPDLSRVRRCARSRRSMRRARQGSYDDRSPALRDMVVSRS